jgi:hypothetical protein
VACSSGCAPLQQARQREAFKTKVVEAQQECDVLYADPGLNPIHERPLEVRDRWREFLREGAEIDGEILE